MSFQWFKLAAIPALAAGLAFSQTTPAPADPGTGATHQHFGRGGGRWAGRMAQYLGLTDAQKVQAKSIMQEAAQSAKPLRDQLRQGRQQMQAAIKANDPQRIQQLSTSQGQTFGQLAAIRNTAFAKVYNTVLTPDQQTKADQFSQQMKQMRQNHRQRQAPNPSNG
jgi:Spy/CpxP family protein refolding chaperone